MQLFSGLFSNTTQSEKSQAVRQLIEHSSPRASFFFMIVLAIAMATSAVLLNSEIVLIASMLVAPMLYPVLALAMGISTGNTPAMSRSILTLLKSIGLAVLISVIITLLFKPANFDVDTGILGHYFEPEMYFLSFLVAVAAGLAGSYSLIKSELSETIPGVAIAGEFIGPLAVMGVSLSHLEFDIARSAGILFLMNTSGIVLSSLLVFSLFHFYNKQEVIEKAIEEDNRELAEEHSHKK